MNKSFINDEQLIEMAEQLIDALHNNDLVALNKVDSNYDTAVVFESGYVDVARMQGSVLVDIIAGHKSSLLKLLLDHGLDPNYVNSHGLSLLEAAVRANDVNILHMLIERGASVTRRNQWGLTPINCLQVNNPDLEEILEDVGDEHASDKEVIRAQLLLYSKVYDKLGKQHSLAFSRFLTDEFAKVVRTHCLPMSSTNFSSLKQFCEGAYKMQYKQEFKTGRKVLQRYYAFMRMLESGQDSYFENNYRARFGGPEEGGVIH